MCAFAALRSHRSDLPGNLGVFTRGSLPPCCGSVRLRQFNVSHNVPAVKNINVISSASFFIPVSIERFLFSFFCILKSGAVLKHGDLSVISEPLHQKCFYRSFLCYHPLNTPPPLTPPLLSPLLPPLLFWPRWLRLKTNEATNMWKDRNLLALSSCVSLLLCHMGHV